VYSKDNTINNDYVLFNHPPSPTTRISQATPKIGNKTIEEGQASSVNQGLLLCVIS